MQRRLKFPLPLQAGEKPLSCGYYAAGKCASCTLLELPQDQQLARKDRRARELLAPFCAGDPWEEPWAATRQAFRNKVKLVVTGSARAPRLGILGADRQGQDLRDCPLPSAGIRTAIAPLARFITECELRPYNWKTDTGELKFVILTEAPSGELMVRFVARRPGVQGILFRKLDRLYELVPLARVVSLNVQPERKAIVEGEREILISKAATLPMELEVGAAPLTLELRPQSFFQTNTAAAEQLYSQGAAWLTADSAWDLYCGVGGFALSLAGKMPVVGVEAAPAAVAAAQAAADELGMPARFAAADATSWALSQEEVPQAVVVNPPRRGIGGQLARWINDSKVEKLLYSSCNIDTLATDMAIMREFEIVRAQVVDMFAHTEHLECIVLAQRR